MAVKRFLLYGDSAYLLIDMEKLYTPRRLQCGGVLPGLSAAGAAVVGGAGAIVPEQNTRLRGETHGMASMRYR